MNTNGVVEKWSPVVDRFISGHAKALPQDEREDLRQDIFLALIESYGPTLERCTEMWAELLALRVLECFREERRPRSLPPNWTSFDTENLVPDSSAPNLDLELDLGKALSQLPDGLRNVAVDLFYHDLSQQEVATKYNRTQPWVAVAKKQIVNRLYSFLKEKTCR